MIGIQQVNAPVFMKNTTGVSEKQTNLASRLAKEYAVSLGHGHRDFPRLPVHSGKKSMEGQFYDTLKLWFVQFEQTRERNWSEIFTPSYLIVPPFVLKELREVKVFTPASEVITALIQSGFIKISDKERKEVESFVELLQVHHSFNPFSLSTAVEKAHSYLRSLFKDEVQFEISPKHTVDPETKVNDGLAITVSIGSSDAELLAKVWFELNSEIDIPVDSPDRIFFDVTEKK